MGAEIALAAEVVPVAAAAIGVYGKAVLATAWDDVADVTIRTGLRVVQRVFGRMEEGGALPGALADVVAHPDDSDVVAQFRLAVRRALEADPALAVEVAAIVAGLSPGASASQHVVADYGACAADRERLLGLDHPDTLGSRSSLALAYQEAGRDASAPPRRHWLGLHRRPSPRYPDS